MKSVNILGNDCLQLALLLPLCQLPVCRIGLGRETKHLILIKTEELFRLLPVKGMTQNGFRRVIILLMIQSIHTPEVWDSTLRRHSCSTEKYNIITVINHLTQLFHRIHTHRIHTLSPSFTCVYHI